MFGGRSLRSSLLSPISAAKRHPGTEVSAYEDSERFTIRCNLQVDRKFPELFASLHKCRRRTFRAFRPIVTLTSDLTYFCCFCNFESEHLFINVLAKLCTTVANDLIKHKSSKQTDYTVHRNITCNITGESVHKGDQMPVKICWLYCPYHRPSLLTLRWIGCTQFTNIRSLRTTNNDTDWVQQHMWHVLSYYAAAYSMGSIKQCCNPSIHPSICLSHAPSSTMGHFRDMVTIEHTTHTHTTVLWLSGFCPGQAG